MQQQQQPANVSGTPVVISVQTAPLETRSRYIPVTSKPAQEFFWLGVAHAVIGMLCIIFQIISFETSRDPSFSFIGHGFWTGSLFVVTGVFGILAGKRGGKCQVITFHVLSTISVVFAVGLLCIGATSAACIVLSNAHTYVPNIDETIVSAVMEAFLAAMGIAEGFVAIRSLVIGCTIGVCCCKCRGSCCCPTDPQYQQLHDPVQPDLQPHFFASSCSLQEPTFNSNQQHPAVSDQNRQQPMFNPNQQQLMLSPNQQQLMLSPNQQQLMLSPNQQQLMLSPNQQQLILSPNQQQLMVLSNQPNVGFCPQHQAVQYYALLPVTVLGSHQTDVSTILSGATGQGQDAGPLTGLRPIVVPTPLPDENTGTSGSNGSDKGHISSDDVEMLSP